MLKEWGSWGRRLTWRLSNSFHGLQFLLAYIGFLPTLGKWWSWMVGIALVTLVRKASRLTTSGFEISGSMGQGKTAQRTTFLTHLIICGIEAGQQLLRWKGWSWEESKRSQSLEKLRRWLNLCSWRRNLFEDEFYHVMLSSTAREVSSKIVLLFCVF